MSNEFKTAIKLVDETKKRKVIVSIYADVLSDGSIKEFYPESIIDILTSETIDKDDIENYEQLMGKIEQSILDNIDYYLIENYCQDEWDNDNRSELYPNEWEDYT